MGVEANDVDQSAAPSEALREWTTIVYQYGLLEPENWNTDCQEHLWLQNKLWNCLVEIERSATDEYRKIIALDDTYATISAHWETRITEQKELRAERRKLRQQARCNVETPTLDERLLSLSREIQGLAAAAKEAALCARKRDDIKPLLIELEKQRKAAAKRARKDSGLWWGNYNAVWRSYHVARSQAIKSKSELRYHGFCGDGRFTVQIIGGASTQEMLSDQCSQAAIDQTLLPVPWRLNKPARVARLSRHGLRISEGPARIGKARPRLLMTIYTRGRARHDRRMLSFPLIYDRPLPTDARVQEIIVRRRRVGRRYRYTASFVLRMPYTAPPVPLSADACGINLGFRIRPDGGLRVAVLADTAGDREYTLSAKWMREMDYVETIRQERDQRRDRIVAILKEAWPRRPEGMPEELTDRISKLLSAPSVRTARLAVIVLQWDRLLGYWPEMYKQLEAWRREDSRRYEFEATLRDSLRLRRREQYRLLASDIARRYGCIKIGDAGLSRIARLEHPDGSETPLHDHARRNRARAALHGLRQELCHQANKRGSTVTSVKGLFTQQCHQCGRLCAVTEELMHRCEHCAAVWDQDANACWNILYAEGEKLGDENGDVGSDVAKVGVAVAG